MVTEAIMNWLIDAFIWLFGTFDPATVDVSGIKAAYSTIAGLDYWLPIHETVTAVFAVLALGPTFVVTTLSIWLGVGVLRGGSAKG